MIATTRPAPNRPSSRAVPSAGTSPVAHRHIRIATTEDDFRAVTERWDRYDAWVASTTDRRLVDAQPDGATASMYPGAGFVESSRRTHLGREAVTMTLDLADLPAGDVELDLEDPVP
jgi:hypothetical protein